MRGGGVRLGVRHPAMCHPFPRLGREREGGSRGMRRRGSTREWRRIRSEVLARDGFACHYCGGPASEVDHVLPVSRGGNDALGNLVAACLPCNRRKGKRVVRTPFFRSSMTGHSSGRDLSPRGLENPGDGAELQDFRSGGSPRSSLATPGPLGVAPRTGGDIEGRDRRA